ncbi:MAG TPA: serine/threonine-protein kinase, partial [Allocoleopsis sp.]
MTNLPDFSNYGYQVTEQLNHNLQGGRFTYKAVEIDTKKSVVIKQFRFATTSNWDDYKEIEREITVLQGLNHAGIPKYLTKFDPGDGLCLVQEYINAQPLSKLRSFSPEQIKSIAIQLLEILVYLQERIPPIFHRDIKPENVLFDDNIQIYLIDFGLARMGNNTINVNSMMGGTLGFMPPEQLQNQKLTEASDLYGLGATLICLITNTQSANIGSLVDFNTNKITFKDKVPKFSI